MLAFVNNTRKDYLKMTASAEVGYSIPINTNWVVNIACQLGGTHFPETGWENHFGIKFQIGRWFNV